MQGLALKSSNKHIMNFSAILANKNYREIDEKRLRRHIIIIFIEFTKQLIFPLNDAVKCQGINQINHYINKVACTCSFIEHYQLKNINHNM